MSLALQKQSYASHVLPYIPCMEELAVGWERLQAMSDQIDPLVDAIVLLLAGSKKFAAM